MDKQSKILIGVLCFLATTIIGLVAGLIVVANNNNASNTATNTGLNGNNLAKECLERNTEDDVIDCLDEKAFAYYDDEHDCAKALKVYDDIPTTQFNEQAIARLYDEAYSLSLECDDEALQNYWEEKNEAAWSHLGGRD